MDEFHCNSCMIFHRDYDNLKPAEEAELELDEQYAEAGPTGSDGDESTSFFSTTSSVRLGYSRKWETNGYTLEGLKHIDLRIVPGDNGRTYHLPPQPSSNPFTNRTRQRKSGLSTSRLLQPRPPGTSSHFHIFVGDLSNEVNDKVLLEVFCVFGPISEARVMWDRKTGRSRGYDFVAFRERSDAEKALSCMDGERLGDRAIRCNWASQKGQPSASQKQAIAAKSVTSPTPFGRHRLPNQRTQSYQQQREPTWEDFYRQNGMTGRTDTGEAHHSWVHRSNVDLHLPELSDFSAPIDIAGYSGFTAPSPEPSLAASPEGRSPRSSSFLDELTPVPELQTSQDGLEQGLFSDAEDAEYARSYLEGPDHPWLSKAKGDDPRRAAATIDGWTPPALPPLKVRGANANLTDSTSPSTVRPSKQGLQDRRSVWMAADEEDPNDSEDTASSTGPAWTDMQ